MPHATTAVASVELGCSKCRYSRKGCSRCKDPAFQARQAAKNDDRPAASELRGGRTKNGKAVSGTAQTAAHGPAQTHRSRAKRKRVRYEEGSAEAAEPISQVVLSRTVPSQLGSTVSLELKSPTQVDMPLQELGTQTPVPSGSSCGLTILPSYHSPSPAVNSWDRNQPISETVEISPVGLVLHITSPRRSDSQLQLACNSSEVATNKVLASPASSSGFSAGNAPSSQDTQSTSFMEQLQQRIASQRGTRTTAAAALAKQPKHPRLTAKQQRVVVKEPRTHTWVPPVSPFGLIEEELYENPWKLLLACMLLNKTSGTQVRRIIWQLFKLYPTPEELIAADLVQLTEIIKPLGLFNKRAVAIQRFSHDYVSKQWSHPMELHGIGQYAADAYFIFCRGEWTSVTPADKDLLKYQRWLQETQGLGTGLMRDCLSLQPDKSCLARGAAVAD